MPTRPLTPLLLTALLAVPAGGDEALDRMAREHAGDAPVPGAAADATAAAAVEGRDVVYAELDGTPVTGYLAPADSKRAVIVIQEYWGLNDNIRTMARELAAAGYNALAVDLYEGEVAETHERAVELLQAALGRADRLSENLRQAHRYLTEQLGMESVGVVGWCFGGGWSLATALDLGDGIDAAVMYYGRLETDPERLAALAAPLLGHFGALDESIPVDSVRAFEATARGLGKDVTVHVYDGADHAFANPSGTAYRREDAEVAWRRTLEFFARHLGP